MNDNTPASTPSIQVQGLRKVFGDKVAVADLTLSVERGEVFGFLGPNGAGKTTAVKMLLGLIRPTAGTGSVLGEKIGHHRRRGYIGFLPEHFRFHDWLTASEFLHLHADLYQIPHASSQKRIPELLELVSLTSHSDKKLRQFSKGMLQRIGIAQALLNQPKLVILDEPTSGLDPVGRRLVRDIIRELRERGTTVFLNSHLLSEVEITCDRVAFIKHGEVLQVSALQSLVDGELTVEARVRPLESKCACRWRTPEPDLIQRGRPARRQPLPGRGWRRSIFPAPTKYLSGRSVYPDRRHGWRPVKS
jgi:ABC-2 type transport system ATP-binding protein